MTLLLVVIVPLILGAFPLMMERLETAVVG